MHQLIFEDRIDELRECLKIKEIFNNPTIGNGKFANINSLHYAALGGGKDALNAVLDDERVNVLSLADNGSSALHLLAARGDPELLFVFLSTVDNARIDWLINLPDINGLTPLHALAMNLNGTPEKIHDRIRCIELLLGRGAKLDVQTKDNKTPYEIAVARGFSNIPAILKEPEIHNSSGLFWSGIRRVTQYLPSNATSDRYNCLAAKKPTH